MNGRKPTWRELVAEEPRLTALLAEAKTVRDEGGPSFCANAVWYGYGSWQGRGFKPRLKGLVGRGAENRDLATSEAYDVAYKKIYDVLPPCRRCLCFPEGMLDQFPFTDE